MQGLPDTETRSVLVDVKDKGGAPTKAQVEKWTTLHAKGIPVYIARTAEDVDAIVAGRAEAWVPRVPSKMTGGRARANQQRLASGMSVHAAVTGNYTPPRSKPVDSVKEAEATFAPAPCDCIGDRHSEECIATGRYE